MAATDLPYEEIKELRGLYHGLCEDLHKVDDRLTELRTEIKDAIRVGKWVVTLVVGLLLIGGVGGVWWASRLTAKLDALGAGPAVDHRPAQPLPKSLPIIGSSSPNASSRSPMAAVS